MSTTFTKNYTGNPKYRCNTCGKRVFGIFSATYHAVKHWIEDRHVFLEIIFDSSQKQHVRKNKLEREIEAFNHAFETNYSLKDGAEGGNSE